MKTYKEQELEKKHVSAIKGGRCWNGAHRDAGAIIHAVPPPTTNGYWGDKSLCGTKPGIRGYGWTEVKRPVTCKNCLKKLSAPPKSNNP